jgi:hypothetical protein
MTELVLHDRPVETVFDLLGHDENDMTAGPALVTGAEGPAPVRSIALL